MYLVIYIFKKSAAQVDAESTIFIDSSLEGVNMLELHFLHEIMVDIHQAFRVLCIFL